MARGQMRRQADGAEQAPAPRQRLDLWLWHARVVRTRVVAQELAASGHVRINGQRATAAGRFVKTGDVLTIALDSRVLVLRIAGFSEQRGRFEDAQRLYHRVSEPDSGPDP